MTLFIIVLRITCVLLRVDDCQVYHELYSQLGFQVTTYNNYEAILTKTIDIVRTQKPTHHVREP